MEKRTAKSLIIIFIFILCLGIKVPALAGSFSDAESQAEALKQLGLMKDDPELSFSFDEELDRVQATVFLIRSTGKDAEAIYGKGSHPFSDVPAWADKYIAYAYEKGLVNGESETTFGTEKADYPMVLTFLLRSLGYNDSEGDFPIKSPENLADA
ncbi:MAG TPA: S-layer homology domain-containing protein, partial [Flexilinea sp.]|nr:S-layer homology domain-containing protein [Flexilinea sp.]